MRFISSTAIKPLTEESFIVPRGVPRAFSLQVYPRPTQRKGQAPNGTGLFHRTSLPKKYVSRCLNKASAALTKILHANAKARLLDNTKLEF